MSSGIIDKNNIYLNRRTIRLKEYDYSKAGAYFVTICADEHENKFGEIIDGIMNLNESGEIAGSCWKAIPEHFPHTQLDDYVIMPNHVHGIIVIKQTMPVGANNYSPLRAAKPHGTSMTIGSIIRGFKIGVTKILRQNNLKKPVWQRNYYEHIIRDNDELNRIRKYIIDNPAKWEEDEYNLGSIHETNSQQGRMQRRTGAKRR